MIEVSAPGKVILFGEHAVVYGQPALAVPVSSLRARVTVEEGSPGRGLELFALERRSSSAPRPVMRGSEEAAGLLYPLEVALATWGVKTPPDLRLTLNSTVPQGRGMGSGAAVAAALIRGLAAGLGRVLSEDALNALVYEVEKKHHGTPSGIDNTVIVYEQPILYIKGQPIQPLSIPQPFHLIIADSGQSVPTRVPVGDVRRLVETRPEKYLPLIEQVGEVTRAAKATLEAGQVGAPLGALMNQAHELLQRLTVSSPQLDYLCEVATTHCGGLGAKMSGGGRGGIVLVLTEARVGETWQSMFHCLDKGGAKAVFRTQVG